LGFKSFTAAINNSLSNVI